MKVLNYTKVSLHPEDWAHPGIMESMVIHHEWKQRAWES